MVVVNFGTFACPASRILSISKFAYRSGCFQQISKYVLSITLKGIHENDRPTYIEKFFHSDVERDEAYNRALSGMEKVSTNENY